MAGLFGKAPGSAEGGGHESGVPGSSGYADFFNKEAVRLVAMVVLGIAAGAKDSFLYLEGCAPGCMFQDSDRVANSAVFDQTCHNTDFSRADPDAIGCCYDCHGLTPLSFLAFSKLAAVTAEFAGWCEFTQLVADHIFCDKNRHMDLAIVDSKGLTDEFGRDATGSSPGLDDRAVFGAQGCHFFGQLGVYERSFFKRSTHYFLLLL